MGAAAVAHVVDRRALQRRLGHAAQRVNEVELGFGPRVVRRRFGRRLLRELAQLLRDLGARALEQRDIALRDQGHSSKTLKETGKLEQTDVYPLTERDSGRRHFERPLHIWNAELQGPNPTLGRALPRGSQSEPMAMVDACDARPARTYDVSAIEVSMPLNRFGDYDPDAFMYVLDVNIHR